MNNPSAIAVPFSLKLQTLYSFWNERLYNPAHPYYNVMCYLSGYSDMNAAQNKTTYKEIQTH